MPSVRALLGQAMASVYSAGQVADALLADAEFRALRLGTWLNTPSGEGVAAAVMALKLDDSIAEAHTSLAYINYVYDWNWPAAEKEFKKSIKLNPKYATAHHWYAFKLAAVGRHDDAIAEMKLARELVRV